MAEVKERRIFITADSVRRALINMKFYPKGCPASLAKKRVKLTLTREQLNEAYKRALESLKD